MVWVEAENVAGGWVRVFRMTLVAYGRVAGIRVVLCVLWAFLAFHLRPHIATTPTPTLQVLPEVLATVVLCYPYWLARALLSSDFEDVWATTHGQKGAASTDDLSVSSDGSGSDRSICEGKCEAAKGCSKCEGARKRKATGAASTCDAAVDVESGYGGAAKGAEAAGAGKRGSVDRGHNHPAGPDDHPHHHGHHHHHHHHDPSHPDHPDHHLHLLNTRGALHASTGIPHAAYRVSYPHASPLFGAHKVPDRPPAATASGAAAASQRAHGATTNGQTGAAAGAGAAAQPALLALKAEVGGSLLQHMSGESLYSAPGEQQHGDGKGAKAVTAGSAVTSAGASTEEDLTSRGSSDRSGAEQHQQHRQPPQDPHKTL